MFSLSESNRYEVVFEVWIYARVWVVLAVRYTFKSVIVYNVISMCFSYILMMVVFLLVFRC